MEILVRAVNISLDRGMRAEVEAKLRESLVPLSHNIQKVTVRLVDQNGPRGGIDISCDIDVRLRPKGRLFILETAAHPLAAVSRAGQAAATAVARTVERARHSRRRRLAGRLPNVLSRGASLA